MLMAEASLCCDGAAWGAACGWSGLWFCAKPTPVNVAHAKRSAEAKKRFIGSSVRHMACGRPLPASCEINNGNAARHYGIHGLDPGMCLRDLLGRTSRSINLDLAQGCSKFT